GPPYATTVRSLRSERQRARTTAIGLRREPQPPMPMVMPERNGPTMSSTVVRLSAISPRRSRGRVRLPLLDEGGALLVGHATHVQLVGEALLEAVAALHVDRVDAVERLFGPADDARALGGDLAGQLERGAAQLVGRDHRGHRSVGGQLGGRDG